MESRTVVLTAMEPEVTVLRSRMSNVSERTSHGVVLTRGVLAGQPVTAVLCGIGKVAAAIAATAVAATEQPSLLLSAGVAGAVTSDLATGSLVVVSGAVEHDYDLRPFVAERSHDFRGPRVRSASEGAVAGLLTAARAVGESAATPVVDAWIATGDHVVTDGGKHDAIRELGAAIRCVDMETYAVACAAAATEIPWAGLRVISDGADEHLEAEPVLTAARDAGALLAHVLEHYLTGLSSRP